MEVKKIYPKLFQVFGCYFNQDFELMVDDFDRSKPVIPQLTYRYKKEVSQKSIDQTIKELEDLINKHYTEDLLDKITYELGMWVNVNYYGYTHMQFLREMLSLLRDEQYRSID